MSQIKKGPVKRMTIKRITSMVLLLSMLTALLLTGGVISAEDTAKLPFTDVREGKWYYNSIKTVYNAGLMTGKSDTQFAPGEAMTRAQFVTILSRMAGADTAGMKESLSFKDTPKKAWYADAVGWAVSVGLTNGYEDNTFRPNASILRQELAVLFIRFFDHMDVTVTGEALVEVFTDKAKLPKWASKEIEALRETGLIGGDTEGNFNPKKNATRAELATILERYLGLTEGDRMEGYLEKIRALKCENHSNYLHYIMCSKAVNLSLETFGYMLERVAGINNNEYYITVSTPLPGMISSVYQWSNFSAYEEASMTIFVVITSRATGKSTQREAFNIKFNRDYSFTEDMFISCTDHLTDEFMRSAWDDLETRNVFDENGSVIVPYYACKDEATLEEYFIDSVFSLGSDPMAGNENEVYVAEFADGDMAKIIAAAAEGGAVKADISVRNTYLDISTDKKTFTVRVLTHEQCVDEMNALIAKSREYVNTLSALMTKCEYVNIPTDYENVALTVIERFADECFPRDIERSSFSKIPYLNDSIDGIFETAKSDLEAYLSGEKEPLNVPRYVTGDIALDGMAYIADTIDSYGNTERRPVYFYGSGLGYYYSVDDIENYYDFGLNVMGTMDCDLYDVIRKPIEGDDPSILSDDGVYAIDTSSLREDLNAYHLAERNDIAMTFLIEDGIGNNGSGKRGLEYLYNAYPDLYGNAVSVGGINETCEAGRQILHDFYSAVAKELASFDCILNVVLVNEPGFNAASFPERYAAAWEEFLRDRYDGDLARLNEVHGASYKSFADVPMVGTTAKLSVPTPLNYDNYQFNNKVITEYHAWVASIVREEYPDAIITTKLKDSDDDDMFLGLSTTPETMYGILDVGGVDSVQDKVFMYDHLGDVFDAPASDPEVHCTIQEYHHFTTDFDKSNGLTVWRDFMHHLAVANIWAWDWDEQPYNWMHRPYALYDMGVAALDSNRLSYELQAMNSVDPDVAVLSSYISRFYTGGAATNIMYDTYNAALYNGEQVRIVSEEQIEKLETVKLLIIPGCSNLLPETVAAIHKYVENGGRVLMVGNDCLTADDFNVPYTGETAEMAEAIYAASDVIMPGSGYSSYSATIKALLDEMGLQRVWILDKSTGKPVEGKVEWTVCEYNGRVLVSVVPMGLTRDTEVEVYLDGNLVSESKDLRRGDVFGSTVTLENNKALFLELGKASSADSMVITREVYTSGDYSYILKADGTAEICAYSGNGGIVTVPATLDGIRVTGIAGSVFAENSSIKKITVSEGITSVGDAAFAGCENLTAVVLPSSVTSLGERAFANCTSLKSVNLGSITEIGERTFMSCTSLVSITIPETAKSIGNHAFIMCESLESLTVPESVHEIGNYAFAWCYGLVSFDFPEKLDHLGYGAFRGCRSLAGELKLPFGLTEIGSFTFYGCTSITSAVIPDSVMWIREKAFYGCGSLSDVTLSKGLLNMWRHAFAGCPIDELVLPYGMMVVGAGSVPSGVLTVPETVRFLRSAGGSNLVEEGSCAHDTCIAFNLGYDFIEYEKHTHTTTGEVTCTDHVYCTNCGAAVLESHGHVYSRKVTLPTCTADGYITYTCRDCGHSYTEATIPAGHVLASDGKCTGCNYNK